MVQDSAYEPIPGSVAGAVVDARLLDQFIWSIAWLQLALTATVVGFHVAAHRLVYQLGSGFAAEVAYTCGIYLGDYLMVTGVFLLLLLLTIFVWRRCWLLMVGLPVVVLGVRAVQLVSLYYYGSFLPPMAFEHLGLVRLYFTSGIVISVLLGVAASIAFVLFLAPKLSRSCPRQIRKCPAVVRRCVWIVVYPLLIISTISAATGWRERIEETTRHGIDRRSPELALVQTLARVLWRPPSQPASLSEEDARELERFGISYRLDEQYPLVRPTVYSQALPARSGEGPPHVIVFFFEGLSAQLLSVYDEAGIATPNLARFAAQGMIAEHYYSHSASTTTGLRGQLCSTYTVSDWGNWFQDAPYRNNLLLCLPHVLAGTGYKTAYFSHGYAEDTNLGPLMQSYGVQQLFFQDKIRAQLLPAQLQTGSGDLDDHQLISGLIQWLQEHTTANTTANATANAQPVFVAVSTFNTHAPYWFSSLQERKKNDSLVRAVTAADDAFGLFWDYLESSGLSEKTIVVATADHAHFLTAEYRQLRKEHGQDVSPLYEHDRIAFLLHDPGRDLPRRHPYLASSTDLAPTLLHLLDINVANPFMGSSLFDASTGREGVFAAMKSRGYILDATNGIESEFPLPIADNRHRLIELFQRWHTFQEQLISENRIWNRRFE